MSIIQPQHRRLQPQESWQLDRKHPMCRDLVFAGIPNHGRMVDALTGQRGTQTGTTPPTLANAVGGRNFLFNGGNNANSYIDFGAQVSTADLQLGPATWFFWVYPTGQGGLAERNDHNAVNGGWLIGVQSDSKIKLVRELAISNSNSNSGSAVTLSAWTSVAVSAVAATSSPVFYIGGTLDSTTVVAAGTGSTASDAAQSLNIGRNFFSPGTSSLGSCAGNIELAYMWRRVLSAAEIASLHANRYQLFKPTARRLWISGAAAAGGGARPQMMCCT